MAAKAVHESKANEENAKAAEAALDVLQKKDDLAQKAEGLQMIKVRAWRCHDCKYLHERCLDKCRDQNHRIQNLQDITKRFFECRNCRHHTSVLNERFMPTPCPKCKSNSWKAAGMRKERNAASEASQFLARGIEHGQFLGSMGGGGVAGVAPTAQRSAGPQVQHANNFVASTPLCEARD